MKKCYLILADGHVFEGVRFGADGEAMGELVFNTGMVDYVGTLTDPCYQGQIVLQTFPQIGNYGMITQDLDSARCHLKGYVAREICDMPSNFRCETTLDEYLKAQGVPGIAGVDTREITRILRESGTMTAKIVDGLPENPADGLAAYRIENAVAAATRKDVTMLPAQGEKKHTVALIDYGAVSGLDKALAARGNEVHLFPASASAADILAVHPDGLILSPGPGDPKDNAACIEEINKLLGQLPLFAVGLGHQLLALAAGADTTKMHHGHRGANQPVKRRENGRTYITCQNHGYLVCADTLPEGAVMSYENANDHTCEGVSYPSINAFSVQFDPESCSTPKGANFLYEQFTALMDKH